MPFLPIFGNRLTVVSHIRYSTVKSMTPFQTYVLRKKVGNDTEIRKVQTPGMYLEYTIRLTRSIDSNCAVERGSQQNVIRPTAVLLFASSYLRNSSRTTILR